MICRAAANARMDKDGGIVAVWAGRWLAARLFA
jgi:hypothetical protein